MTAAGPRSLYERRPAIDVARILALGVVVLGHLVLAVIDRGPDGSVRGENLLELRPGWSWLAMLSPMPVFFAAAGWANLRSDLRSSAVRLRALIGFGAAVITAWVGLLAVTWLVAGEPGVVSDAARIATQPLWFLAAYVPLVASGPFIARAVSRPAVAIGFCLAVLVALDTARFGGGAPEWIGWPGFAAAWAVPWMVGAWWRLRSESGPPFDERRMGALLAIGGGLCALLLVRAAGYSSALIDVVPGARSNTTPPTIYTAAAAIGQVGLFMVVAQVFDLVGRRWARTWGRVGEEAVGVYLLHLSALCLCAALVAVGAPAPLRLTGWWWATRPLWWASVLAVTALLVGVVAAIRSQATSKPSRTDARRVPDWALRLGVALAALGGAVVGLRGPRTLPTALACVVAFVGSWWVFGRRPVHGVPVPGAEGT